MSIRPHNQPPRESWTLPVAAKALGLHPTTLLREARKADFPKPHLIVEGTGLRVWDAEAIRLWRARIIRERRRARRF